MANMKPCPYCAEEIRQEATRCRYCRSRLTSFNPDRWHRSHPEAQLAGVCAAVARALAVPAAAVRLVFVVLTFIHLLGPLLYAGLWLVVPRRAGEESPLETALHWGLDHASRLSGRSHGRPRPPSVSQSPTDGS